MFKMFNEAKQNGPVIDVAPQYLKCTCELLISLSLSLSQVGNPAVIVIM